MDKRISWNFDSGQHATFNPLRPIAVPPSKTVVWPPASKTDSQFGGSRARFPDQNPMLGAPAINIRIFHRRFILRAGVAALILIGLWVIAIGPEPASHMVISPDELVRAVTIQREPLIDLALMEHVDPNGHDAQGRTPLLIATSQQDWKTAQRLLGAGALVDLADKNGFTPLMAAAMHSNLEIFRELLARSANLHAEVRSKDGNDLLGLALDGGNPNIVKY